MFFTMILRRSFSELANVSHSWLPYWVRGGVTHSLCLVFYNEFDTFAQKVTTVTHFEHTAIRIPCFSQWIWDAHLTISECITHLAPILGAQWVIPLTLPCVLQWFCYIRYEIDDSYTLGTPMVRERCKVCQFWDVHLTISECITHSAPILGAQ